VLWEFLSERSPSISFNGDWSSPSARTAAYQRVRSWAREQSVAYGTPEAQVFRCPSDHDHGQWTGMHKLTSYIMNGAVRGYGQNIQSYRFDQMRPDSVIFWGAQEESASAAAWNDGSSYPYENETGFSARHGNGAPVGVVDGSTRWITHQEYEGWADLRRSGPNPLWCDPRHRMGGKNP